MSNLTIANIKAKMNLGSNQEYIGSTVFWELSDANLDYDKLKKLLDDNGLDSRETKDGGLMPRRITPCSAWKRAIAELKKSDYVRSNKLVIDVEDIAADKAAGTLPSGLLTVHVKNVDGGNSHVGFQQQWAIGFDKQVKDDVAGNVAIERKYVTNIPEKDDALYSEVVAQYERALREVNLNDVRETIKRILKAAHAFSMRKQGGIYFVPHEFRNAVTTLEGIVGNIGTSALQVLDLPKTSTRTIETFKHTLADALETEITQLEKTLEERIENIRSTKDGKVTATYESIIEEMQEFNSRADFYSEVLQAKHGELMTKWNALNQKVQERVASLS